jgi:hypothetical protein
MTGGGAQSDVAGSVDPAVIEECRLVVLGFHDVIDRGHATSAVDFLDDDATIELRGVRLEGSEILAFLAEREKRRDRRTVHVLDAFVVEAASPTEVRIGSRLMVFGQEGDGRFELERVLDVSHTLRGHGRSWRIFRRTARPFHPPDA